MPSVSSIDFAKIKIEKLSSQTLQLNDFKCSNPQFERYLAVNTVDDHEKRIGQTWLFCYHGKIIGFITIAMSHMKRHESFDVDTYGNIPALLIGYLATHKDYERKGIGTFMVQWACNQAVQFSKSIGCRLVMLDPENNAVGFYKKLHFSHISNSNDDVMFVDLIHMSKS